MGNTIEILNFPHEYDLSPPTQSATTLVFVHGWLLSRAYWQPIIQKLAVDYQCLSYDLRGFGGSQQRQDAIAPEPRSLVVAGGVAAADARLIETGKSDHSPLGYSPAEYAQDLVILLRRLNIRNAWVIGHSLGGSVALWAADQAPQVIQGVISVSMGGGIYIQKEFETFRQAGQQLVRLRPSWLADVPFLDVAMSRMAVAQPIARRWGQQRLKDWAIADAEAAMGSLLDSTTEAQVHQLPRVVTRLKQPVHFITGQEDRVMEPKYVHHLASFHPSSEGCSQNVSEIPNCGHMGIVEQPDAIAQTIRQVLNLA
jgi:2-succinyl-6-hydroxy-2,4-cyclohexadiene-1-carboxylate synthase